MYNISKMKLLTMNIAKKSECWKVKTDEKLKIAQINKKCILKKLKKVAFLCTEKSYHDRY